MECDKTSSSDGMDKVLISESNLEGYSDFYKNNEESKIWWIDKIDFRGELLFSFDQQKIYNLFLDYPHNMTEAFETKAIEIAEMIDSYSSSLDGKKRDIFYNLFFVSQKQKQTLKELYNSLDIDKTEYDHIKSEILLDFARRYREGALMIYQE